MLTHNLRAELTSFIGRDNELREVELLIGDRRLVTLTGVGGCGKTRLAAQVCNRLGGRWPDGVWWIDLGSLSEPDLVVRTVASALGVLIEPKGDQLQALAAQLRQQHLLLCLDTCEHLLDAVAAVTDTVLRACPGVSVLTTSREPLGVAGETVWRVPSLRADEAVLLFTDRATLVAPGFTPGNHQAEVRSVCRRVDGIPLAIELAAAWAPALAPKQIASGLDESFRLLEGGPRRALPRHQALTASMEWSHALLEDGEQEVFRRLGVFAGSFSLDAARAVGSDDAGEDVLTRVRRLVDKSLVVVHGGAAETRYRLLDTVRQYAQERLRDAAEGDDEVFGLPVEWLDGGGVPGDVVGAAAVVGSTAERDLGSPVELEHPERDPTMLLRALQRVARFDALGGVDPVGRLLGVGGVVGNVYEHTCPAVDGLIEGPGAFGFHLPAVGVLGAGVCPPDVAVEPRAALMEVDPCGHPGTRRSRIVDRVAELHLERPGIGDDVLRAPAGIGQLWPGRVG